MLTADPLISVNQTVLILVNVGLTIGSLILALYMAYRAPASMIRPAFIIATLVIIFYQLPFLYFANSFSQEMLDIWWFAMSIYTASLGNLLWVYFTPQLNCINIFNEPTSPPHKTCFNDLELYFSLGFFCLLLGIYLYKVPPTCTAIYAIFFDPALALLIREISVKLVGTNIATYALSILSSTVIPIICFLIWNIMINCLRKRNFFYISMWFVVLAFCFMAALISGAKGNLVPTFVAMSVAGFLSANRWYQRLFTVFLINAMLCSILIGFSHLRPIINLAERGSYPFGSCVVKLQVCKEVPILLNSLESHDFSLDLTKSTLHALERESELYCRNSGNFTRSESIVRTPPILTASEKRIVVEIAHETPLSRFKALINRAFVTPLTVAHWHFLYITAYGKPGWLGISIAKRLSSHYIDMPSKICNVYEFIRSHGDKTTTCSAPTSYLFTYPAYMGLGGLILATLATILLDMLGAVLTKYLSAPLRFMAVGLIAVAGINCMTADFTTVLLSHGAGITFIILIFFYFCRTSVAEVTSNQELP